MSKSLYICYFGVQEPLVQTQVIPYLRELVKGGHELTLLTFEPGDRVAELQSYGVAELQNEEVAELQNEEVAELQNEEVAELQNEEVTELQSYGVAKLERELAELGIEWHWLRYHKRPTAPATLYDVLNGSRFIAKLMRTKKFDVLHARIHIPMLMAAIARKLSSHKPKLLFDIRGFFPEEYTDAGIWKENGLLYRSVKRVERWLMKEADGFVVLTEKAREILFPESTTGDESYDKQNRPIETIPCCIDLDRFKIVDPKSRLRIRCEIGAEGKRVIAYVGSFGGWYLSDEMMDLFAVARKVDPGIFVLILTQRDTVKVINSMLEKGFSTADFLVKSVPPSGIPDLLCAADFAISFIKPCYSKQASSPTKNAEYLISGLPILANRGVGDVDEVIQRDQVGILLDGFNNESYANALENMEQLTREPGITQRCRQVATRRFDLIEVAGTRYRRIYEKLLQAR